MSYWPLLRLRVEQALAPAVRGIVGIQLAPPFVACGAYFAVHGGAVDGFALMLVGAAFWQLADAGRLGWSLILGLWALAAGICLLFPQPGPFLLLALASAFMLAKAGGAG